MLARALTNELAEAKDAVVNVTTVAESRVHPFTEVSEAMPERMQHDMIWALQSGAQPLVQSRTC